MDMEFRYYLVNRPEDHRSFALLFIAEAPFDAGTVYEYFSEKITLFNTKDKWRSIAFFDSKNIIKGSNNLEELKELAYMEML